MKKFIAVVVAMGVCASFWAGCQKKVEAPIPAPKVNVDTMKPAPMPPPPPAPTPVTPPAGEEEKKAE